MQSFDANIADPFALYHAPLASARRWRATCVALALLVALLGAALAVASVRPPTVIVYDRSAPESLRIARVPQGVPVTQADARLFFSHMLQLRYGWDSLTVKRDLEQFLGGCYRPARERELAFLRAAVAANERERPISRLSDYMRQSVSHRLVLPAELDQIDCRRRGARQQWDCYVRADVHSRPLFTQRSSPADANVKQSLQFVATLLEAPRTTHTPYGLVLAALHHEPVPSPSTASAEGL